MRMGIAQSHLRFGISSAIALRIESYGLPGVLEF
jgi:hypothetical protein